MNSHKTTATSASCPIVPSQGMGLYIHVPFCQTRCPYCDFNTYQGIDRLMEPYAAALNSEIAAWGKVLSKPQVNTVFFGGGTPSYLPDGALGRILSAAQAAFAIKDNAEVTVEANPGDLSQEACRRLLEQGVNRLSIGVQSLDDGLLNLLGRRHSAAQAVQALQDAQQAGLKNINLDLMYGLPHQAMAQWRDTLHQMMELRPAHLSLYCLTLEEGTPLHAWVAQGKLPEPDPDLAADMYHYAEDVLERHGYQHYEISNWSLPGRQSQHNLTYWRNLPYLGVGPGAHSRLGSFRFWDMDSPLGYIAQVKKWAASNPPPLPELDHLALEAIPQIGGQEEISPEVSASETMFLGLRLLLEGLDLAAAQERTGLNLASRYKSEIAGLIDQRLLGQQGTVLRLTKPAYLVSNQVFTRFLA
ncbi:MAG: radical SAM family heme chaperone HemW [SAR202 cluster bacterium]|nr:radical SAM family heme chaperone HemW [SAR202 cluster bacterium]